jgi:transposase
MAAGMAQAYALRHALLTMIRERRGDALEAWMTEAMDRGIDALARFARGLPAAWVAGNAGLPREWSNGIPEGQLHRLKRIHRQGDGRAGCALLRQRVLPAASRGDALVASRVGWDARASAVAHPRCRVHRRR